MSWFRVAAGLVLGVSAIALGAQTQTTVGDEGYSQKTVAQLIDDLARIDAPAPGLDGGAMHEGFIADGTAGEFTVGVLGVPAPKVPAQMRELVRRGPASLPELVKHLGDKRATGLVVGNLQTGREHQQVGVNAFMWMEFGDEYDPRVRQQKRIGSVEPKPFEGSYVVKVGDVCFALIGQIVSRRLYAVRYQPSGGLIVNSPIESGELARQVRLDWGQADATTLKASLLSDIQNNLSSKDDDKKWQREDTLFGAFVRLKFYFPNDYQGLEGDAKNRKLAFERTQGKTLR